MKNFSLQLILHSFLKVCVIIGLVIAASTRQEYSYYIFLRWFVSATLTYFAVNAFANKQIGLLIFFVTTVLLFNPFKKFIFQKQTWHLIDYIIAGFIIITIALDWISNYPKSK